MISATSYVKITFDTDGQKKILDAYKTLNAIISAIQDGGVNEETQGIIDSLDDAACHLNAILDGTIW